MYWVGPFAGSILAVLEFKLIKALEYTTVNGEESTETKRPDKDLESQRPEPAVGSPASQATTLHPQDHSQGMAGVSGPGLGSVQRTHAALPREQSRQAGAGLGNVQSTHAALPRDPAMEKQVGY